MVKLGILMIVLVTRRSNDNYNDNKLNIEFHPSGKMCVNHSRCFLSEISASSASYLP